MTVRTIAISGTRRTGHTTQSEVFALFAAFLSPFLDDGPGGCVLLGGAIGIDTLALRWLFTYAKVQATVVVPATAADQPEGAQQAIKEALEAGCIGEVVELRHPEFPSTEAYHARNRWMVDRADLLVAFPLAESRSGGTHYTVDYAAEKRVPHLIVPL